MVKTAVKIRVRSWSLWVTSFWGTPTYCTMD